MTSSRSITRWQIYSAFLGNLFEHYCTALFGLLSPFLAPLFFPTHHPTTALILTYAIIPLGMLARPLGALFFGYIGDVYGRRHALFLSLLGMAVITALIAFSPTYRQIGIFAPVLLSMGRIGQNFFAAGEIIGGAVYLLEHTPEKRQDLISSFYNSSTIGGALLASGGVSLLYYFDCMESGWRGLYLLGCLTGIFGCFLRLKLPDSSPNEKKIMLNYTLSNLLKIFWEWRQPLLLVIVASGFYYATYSVALVLINGFVPLVSSITQAQVMSLNTFLLIFDFLLLPLFGLLAMRFSRKKMMFYAALCAAFSGIPLFFLLEGASFYMLLLVRVNLVIIGVWFSATFHSWSQKLVPATHRYIILSFGYAIGSQLLGAPTAAISLWIFQQTGIVSSVAWYWVFLALASSIGIAKSKEFSKNPFQSSHKGESSPFVLGQEIS